jgi:signal transduction histidine kinase
MREFLGGLVRNGRHRDTAATEQIYFIWSYSIIGFVAFLIFGLQYLIAGDRPIVGYLELLFSLGFVANAFVLSRTGNIDIAKITMLIITFTFLMVMLVSGGIAGTGLLWFYVFPVVAFFLTNSKEGTVWMALLFAFTVTLWWLPNSLVSLPYDDIVIRQALVCLLVVTLGVFFYQLNRDKASRREQAVDRSKSEFLTLTSHQLRTPISAIGWFGEMLLTGDAGKLNKEQREHIQHIYESNQRLASIVDAMLTVSGLELKQLEVRPEAIDLPELSRTILAEQVGRQPEKDLHITEAYGELPKLRLDRRLTKIILHNVFSNAVKYTPKGGSISIAIDRSSDKLHANSKGSVIITVTDTGYGISQSQQKSVFSKLFRAENIKVKDTDGTGLGLYIVKEVLDSVGGRIWFVSIEGKGSTFYVQLPIEGMKQKK